MINDSLVRLDELERAYKALQASHSKLLADYQALGGKVRKSHTKGSIDPDEDYENFPKVVLGNPKFLTKDELASELLESFRKVFQDLKIPNDGHDKTKK